MIKIKKLSFLLVIGYLSIGSLSLKAQEIQKSQEAKDSWGLMAPSVFASRDSDHFHVTKIGTGLLPFYKSGQDYLGIQASTNHYSSPEWAKDGGQASLVQRSINSKTGLGSIASLGVSNLYGRDLLIADVSYSAPITDTFSYETFFFRDWVETRNSLTNGISHNYYGGSLEKRVATDWTVIGLLAQQKFSDSNIRNHLRAKVIYDLLPEQGINLQLRHRQYRNSHDVTVNYFNPNEYDENMAVVGWRKKVQGWQLSGVAGLGRQKINDDPYTTTQLLEIEAVSPIFNKIFLRSKAGYSDSAGFGGPDYSYKYFQTDLIFQFN
jgi:hypothetical protein